MMKSMMTRSARVALELGEALAAVGGFAHAIALLVERVDDEAADVGIVVDDEDRCRRGARRLRAARPSAGRRLPSAPSPSALRNSSLTAVPSPGALSMRAAPPDWRAMP